MRLTHINAADIALCSPKKNITCTNDAFTKYYMNGNELSIIVLPKDFNATDTLAHIYDLQWEALNNKISDMTTSLWAIGSLFAFSMAAFRFSLEDYGYKEKKYCGKCGSGGIRELKSNKSN